MWEKATKEQIIDDLKCFRDDVLETSRIENETYIEREKIKQDFLSSLSIDDLKNPRCIFILKNTFGFVFDEQR